MGLRNIARAIGAKVLKTRKKFDDLSFASSCLLLGNYTETGAVAQEGHLQRRIRVFKIATIFIGVEMAAVKRVQATVTKASDCLYLSLPVVSHPCSSDVTLVSNASKSRRFTPSMKTLVNSPITKLDDVKILKAIGRGATGKVYKVEEKSTGKTLALKVMDKRKNLGEDVWSIIDEQAALKRVMGHDGFLHLEASFHDDRNFYLITSYHSGGDLSDEIFRCGRLTTEATRLYTAQLVLGLEALHSEGVIHRDLKPSNILLDADGSLVIADLGFARVFSTKRQASVRPYWMDPDPDSSVSSESGAEFLSITALGTPSYIAPEIIEQDGYGFSVDWWALGVTVYEMRTGRHPWDAATIPELFECILNDPVRFERMDDIEPETENFLQGMLTLRVDERMSVREIKRHCFFQDISWRQIAKRDRAPVIPMMDVTEPLFGAAEEGIEIESGELYDAVTDPYPQYTFNGSMIKPGVGVAWEQEIEELDYTLFTMPVSRTKRTWKRTIPQRLGRVLLRLSRKLRPLR